MNEIGQNHNKFFEEKHFSSYELCKDIKKSKMCTFSEEGILVSKNQCQRAFINQCQGADLNA